MAIDAWGGSWGTSWGDAWTVATPGGAGSAGPPLGRLRPRSQPSYRHPVIPFPLKQPQRWAVRGVTVLSLTLAGSATFRVPTPPAPAILLAPPQPRKWTAKGVARLSLSAKGSARFHDTLPSLRMAEDAVLCHFGCSALVCLSEGWPTSDSGDVALGGSRGDRVEALLGKAIEAGVAALADLAREAVGRLLATGPASLYSPRFFTEEERHRLAEVLASVTATAELLGRSLIRDQQYKTLVRRGVIQEQLVVLNESLLNVTPPLMAPEQALSYFTSLVPTLGIDPQRFGATQRRRAFTLAAATDSTLLDSVKTIIRDRIATGEEMATSAKEIESVLDAAGVTPKNPQYSSMVFRTNMMDSYNTGADAERQHPDVIDTFPVWRYSAVDDGRGRPSHVARDGNYYPSQVPFVVVRGTGIADAANCRCVAVPIDKWDWQTLQGQGARIADGFGA